MLQESAGHGVAGDADDETRAPCSRVEHARWRGNVTAMHCEVMNTRKSDDQ